MWRAEEGREAGAEGEEEQERRALAGPCAVGQYRRRRSTRIARYVRSVRAHGQVGHGERLVPDMAQRVCRAAVPVGASPAWALLFSPLVAPCPIQYHFGHTKPQSVPDLVAPYSTSVPRSHTDTHRLHC
eukprot:1757111-Rhodomonas_salina.1